MDVYSQFQKDIIQEPGSQDWYLRDKSDGKKIVINLKYRISFIPYQHFEMEGLHLLKDLVQKGNYTCKMDLKDAYFTLQIDKEYREFLRF